MIKIRLFVCVNWSVMFFPGEIVRFLKNVSNLRYVEKPEYEILRKILLNGLEQEGICYKETLDLTSVQTSLNECTIHHRKVSNETIKVKSK